MRGNSSSTFSIDVDRSTYSNIWRFIAKVVYLEIVGLVLPSTPGDKRWRILDAMERLLALRRCGAHGLKGRCSSPLRRAVDVESLV